MNKLLSEVLEDISHEYLISNEVISPIITKLSAEFYIKLSDFKNLSEQKWAEYQFPDNLYYLLKEKYDTIAQKESSTVKAELEAVNDVNESNKEYQKNNKGEEINNNVDENNKENEVNDNVDNDKANEDEEQIKKQKTTEPQLTNEEINEALTNIDNEIENINTRSDVIGLIEGILMNIMMYPKEEKYRKINSEKIKIRFPYNSVIDFFTLCKFTRDNYKADFLHYSKPSNWLRNILPAVYGHYEISYNPNNKDQPNNLKNSLRESLFKPYESTKQTKNENNKRKDKANANKKESEEEESEEESEEEESEEESDSEEDKEKENKLRHAYEEEKKRQHNIINSSVIVRLPKCYFLTNPSNLKTLRNIKRTHKYVPNKKDKELLESQKQLIKENKNKSTSEICKKFEKLLNREIVTAGDFYFHFPDNYIIKGTFGLVETIEDLYNFVRQYIINPDEDFDLLYGKQKYKLKETEKKLNKYKLDFTSPIILEVFFPEDYCKLKESEINKMKLNFI